MKISACIQNSSDKNRAFVETNNRKQELSVPAKRGKDLKISEN